ncbi:MAG: RNA ligase [Campylobacteraceae bacterium]
MKRVLQNNTFYILRGVPASGKSTFLKKLNDKYNISDTIVSTDEIRKRVVGTITLNDREFPKNNADVLVFNIVKQVLDFRLKNKLLTFLDATNINDNKIKDYVKIAKNYNVDFEVLIFPYNKVKKFNEQRDSKVTNSVLEKMIKEFSPSSKYTYRNVNIKDEYEIEYKYKASDDVKPIFVGDLHGMYDEFMKILNFYKFRVEDGIVIPPDTNTKIYCTGDLIDRGANSIKLLELFINNPTVLYSVMGNHDLKVLNYLKHPEKIFSHSRFPPSFSSSIVTYEEILKLDETKKDEIIRFLDNLPPYMIFEKYNKVLLHGTVINFNLTTSLTELAGLYKYQEYDSEKEYDKAYQSGINKFDVIRGHCPLKSKVKHTISLDGHLGQDDGYVLALDMENNKTKKFKPKKYLFNNPLKIFTTIHKLKNEKFLNYTIHQSGEMIVVKYAKNVFWKNLWQKNEFLLKARGLVLDYAGNIIQHPFDKCFNYKENGAGASLALTKKVVISEKINGFLCLVTLYKDELFFTTTSSFDSTFIQLAKDSFSQKNKSALKEFLQKRDLTLMFEVVTPKDPHIIKYEKDEFGVYLIGARGKLWSDKALSEDEVDEVYRELAAKSVNIKRPNHIACTFKKVLKLVKSSESITFFDEDKKPKKCEGFIVRDAKTGDTLLKFKTPFYLQNKFFARLSEKNISSIWNDFEAFKRNFDEELYPLALYLKDKFSEKKFKELKEAKRLEVTYKFFDKQI